MKPFCIQRNILFLDCKCSESLVLGQGDCSTSGCFWWE